MVDFSLEIKKAQQINIKQMEFNGCGIDSNIKKSIILYNMAIGEIKKGNLDLAVYDLKKALSYNRDFSEAIKLMGLCYTNMNEYKKAKKIFKKLAKYEIYDELANVYIQSLVTKKSMGKNINTIEYVEDTCNSKLEKSVVINRSKRKIIIGLSIVPIIMAGGIISYSYGSYFQNVVERLQVVNNVVDHEDKTQEETQEEAQNNTNVEISLPEENTIAYEEYEKIEKNLEVTKSELDSYKSKYNILTMLNEAEQCFNNGDYEKTGTILISLKSMNLDDEAKIRSNKLWEGLKGNVLWDIYNQGNMLYKQQKYAEALPKLKIASEIDPNLYLMPWITYQIGTCYKETNDNTNALIYFKQVKENYPQSEYAPNAEMIIKQIET